MAADIEPTTNTSEETLKHTRAPRGVARKAVKSMRSVAIFGAIGALVAGVAFPAYAASSTPVDATATLQQVAADDAQSLVVASEATTAPLDRGTYAATTPEEIEKAKVAKAAAAAARAAAAAAVASTASTGSVDFGDYALVSPGSGEVRYPLPQGSYTVARTLSSGHDGADMSGPSGTPTYSAAAGVVRTSGVHPNYGEYVVIDHVVGGRSVSTLYGHLSSGTRLVQAGQTVAAGQLIGQRGSTGRSTGPHLHFEVRIDGALIEPIAWLATNAG